MKWRRESPGLPGIRFRNILRAPFLAAIAALFFGLLVARQVVWAGLPEWVRNIESVSALEAALFRSVTLPGGEVSVPRPPREARSELTRLIAAAPSSADLVALRAREDEQALDFQSAESDWRQAAKLAADPAAGRLALADFYHRRLKPKEEIATLAEVARAASPDSERLTPPTGQRSWRAFERINKLLEAQALPPAAAVSNYQAWLDRYPREAAVYKQFFDFLAAHRQFDDAGKLVARYEQAFPDDRVFPMTTRATLEYRQGSTAAALALYDREFQPLWPPELVKNYFDLLGETHQLREYLGRARSEAATNPDDLNAAARIFYYYQQQGNLPDAARSLIEFRDRKESRKSAWKADELYTLGQLLEGVNDYDEAARCYYALYSLPGATSADGEEGLAGLAGLLLGAPEQPIQFGSGNLSLYRDIATMDAHPGFLNGILSLVFNWTQPGRRYAEEEQSSVAYFHRAEASELVELFDRRFPESAQRPELHLKLIEAYAASGASDAVIRGGREFLASFPKSPQRASVMLMVADAFALTRQTGQEFAMYDAALTELAAQAGGVPLGEGATGENQPAGPGAQPAVAGARSPEYARVLDRYISRLVAMRQPMRVLELYRREIDRNPNDPGLYERLAAFLEVNRFDADLEETYRLAMARFPDRSWYQRLARWYLRRQRTDDFRRLTLQVVKTFSGSELESYLRGVVIRGSVSANVYLQVNLYAHQRFPHNLAFINNLLSAYQNPQSYDLAAWERLLRSTWFYDDSLRARFFEFLSSNGRLDAELEAAKAAAPRNPKAAAGDHWQEFADSNPAAADFVAEGEAWRSHFEAVAPVFDAVAGEYPADPDIGGRAAEVDRSLAGFTPQDTANATAIEKDLHRSDPRNRAILTRLGEIYADREMYARARPYWNLIPAVEPGEREGYIEAAAIFWDYFLFDDALRLIAEGRKNLSDPALYAYEAGAIHENRRDYPAAIREYLKGALAESGDSPARSRLLVLARRPSRRAAVDAATGALVSVPNPSAGAISLRVAVLEAQGRRDDLGALLTTLVQGAASAEALEQLRQIAGDQGFDAAEERSFEREIAITTDPVDKMRLRLSLAQFEEGRNRIDAARQVIESLDRDDPLILGVVRASADFYWRNKLTGPAIDRLVRSASSSYPGLKKSFLLEAAHKSIEAGDTARARSLLRTLLQDDPFNADYLAAMSDSYARTGDDKGLRDFTLATIKALGNAPLSAEERTERVAALRRGLIPALTRLGDFAGAVDQYVEIINRYAEDENVTQEAANYAEGHGRKAQLLDYYTRTAAGSPRDFRWPMVLARLETYFEDFPAAVAAYGRALSIRPDRSDLAIARAGLQERLMLFDDAARSYSQIYELTYHDPAWMEKIAQVRARQGQTAEAVAALDRARVEGRPERPSLFFGVAKQLERWNMLPEARRYAERGITQAGAELLSDPESEDGAVTYARIMTRLRLTEEAYARLTASRRDAANAAGSGPNAAGIRERLEGQASAGFQQAAKEMGATVDEYFTPEEKQSLAAFLEKQRAGMSAQEVAGTLLPLVEAAGLADLEAGWRFEVLKAQEHLQGQEMYQLIQLQQRRMKFDELGAQLEAYAATRPNIERPQILDQAAQAYESAEDVKAELRVLAMFEPSSSQRYLPFLRLQNPGRLLSMAGPGFAQSTRDMVANFAVGTGDATLALQVIEQRGQGLPPVWTRAYTALAGLYDADLATRPADAFLAALGGGTIGERIAKPVDRQQQLAGGVWFYYASRYGEYLGLSNSARAEDYLPAALEGTPANPDVYFTLAEYHGERKDDGSALADYRHVVELDPLRGDAHDRMAVILWDQGKQSAADAEWKSALAAFTKAEDRNLAASWWADVAATLDHIGRHGRLTRVREDADKLLRTYVRRNGTYNVEALLEAAVAASPDPPAGVQWVIDLSQAAPDPLGFLGTVVDAPWIPDAQRELVLKRILEVAEQQLARSFGTARTNTQSILEEWRMRWITYLADTRQAARAQAALDGLPEDFRKAHLAEIGLIEVRIAARNNTLGNLLTRFRSEPASVPPNDTLAAAAAKLTSEGDADSARRVLEFVYTSALDAHDLSAANFLGLAGIRLETGQVPDAVAVLRRMTLVSGEPFQNLEPAAALLEKHGRDAEAAEFLAGLVKATPWDFEARRRYAADRLKAGSDRERALGMLVSIAGAPEAAYASRAAAAADLGSAKAIPASSFKSGSAELALLAGESGSAPAQPYYYDARLAAAAHQSSPAGRVRLLLEAIAIKPSGEAPRVPLFRAAIEQHRDRLAVLALEPLLGPEGAVRPASSLSPRVPVYGRRAGGAVIVSSNYGPGGAESAPSASADWFLSGRDLTQAERALLATQLAESYQRLDLLGQAEEYLRVAASLESSEPLKVTAKLRAAAVTAELERRAKNERRRPVVSVNLEQANVVRPRLPLVHRAGSQPK